MEAKHCMSSPPRTQTGVAIVFATLAMEALIGAGALALNDGDHVLPKSKLQDLSDSVAPGAEKLIDLGRDHNEAITMGNLITPLATFGINFTAPEFSTLLPRESLGVTRTGFTDC